MNYTALYRKFRPTTFDDMVGQEHITKTLKNQIKLNRVGHAYLFNGGRGTGKTTSAKVLARAINCLNPEDGEPCNECEICKEALNGSLTDIVEMDAASNNGVDDIRQIREEVNFLPTKAKYRVYIIDEVHMLSQGAFNALLKTLEEPPEHVKFILATTEPQKLPATILSRCQRFDFKQISNDDIIKRLQIVCDEMKIEITPEALNVIAVLAEGGMRDALSILERCLQDGNTKIDEDKVKDLVGIPKLEYINKIVTSINNNDVNSALEIIDEVVNQGKDIQNFLWEIIKYVKDILVYKSSKKLDIYSKDEIEQINTLSENMSKEKLLSIIYTLSNLENDLKYSSQKQVLFQVEIIKLCSGEVVKKDVEAISDNTQTATNIDNNEIEKIKAKISGLEYQVSKLGSSINNISQNVNNNTVEQPKKVNNTSPVQSKKDNVVQVASNIDIEKIQTGEKLKGWPKILGEIKNSGKMMLYKSVENSVASKMDDLRVAIEFPNGVSELGKSVLSRTESITELERRISVECGKPMKIKLVDSSQKTNTNTNLNPIENFAKGNDIPFNIVD